MYGYLIARPLPGTAVVDEWDGVLYPSPSQAGEELAAANAELSRTEPLPSPYLLVRLVPVDGPDPVGGQS